jgi:hypothetical protein
MIAAPAAAAGPPTQAVAVPVPVLGVPVGVPVGAAAPAAAMAAPVALMRAGCGPEYVRFQTYMLGEPLLNPPAGLAPASSRVVALCQLMRPCSRRQWDLLRKLWRTAVARPFVGPSANKHGNTWDHEMYYTAVDFFYREHDDPVAMFKCRPEWEAKTAKKYAGQPA